MLIERLFHIKINTPRDHSNAILANFFLHHKKDIQSFTLQKIMMETSLSKSTIIRFVQLLGSNNYTQFIYDYQAEIDLRRQRGRMITQQYKTFGIEVIDIPKILEIDEKEITSFIDTCVNKIVQYKKVNIITDLKDMQLIQTYLPHFFDIDIHIDIYWNILGETSRLRMDQDIFYMVISTHNTLPDLQYYVNQIVEDCQQFYKKDSKFDKALIAYPSLSSFGNLTYEIKRNMYPLTKKVLLLHIMDSLLTGAILKNREYELKK